MNPHMLGGDLAWCLAVQQRTSVQHLMLCTKGRGRCYSWLRLWWWCRGLQASTAVRACHEPA
jgi:hypothetical protein